MTDISNAATTADAATRSPRARWLNRLGRVGVWSIELRTAPAASVAKAAHDLETAGFRSLWIPGLDGGGVFESAQRLLEATREASVVIGVQSIWRQEAADLAAGAAAVAAMFPNRLLTGVGISGAEVAHSVGKPFTTPVAEMGRYLDDLDSAVKPLSEHERLLGSLGPRMAALGAARTVGLHPFLVPAEASVGYREIIGDESLLAPHLAVVLDTDPRRAREIARHGVGFYFGLYTYQGNLRRLGFGDDDVLDGGSDRLIDALVAWGDLEAIRARIQEHLDAGADHVTLHVISPDGSIPEDQWAQLAQLLPTFA